MSLIALFISHSVQPGTSFAATPTLSLFKELHMIATRLVARVSPQFSHNIERLPESDGSTQSDFMSSSRLGQMPARSLYSDSNTETETLSVSD